MTRIFDDIHATLNILTHTHWYPYITIPTGNLVGHVITQVHTPKQARKIQQPGTTYNLW